MMHITLCDHIFSKNITDDLNIGWFARIQVNPSAFTHTKWNHHSFAFDELDLDFYHDIYHNNHNQGCNIALGSTFIQSYANMNVGS